MDQAQIVEKLQEIFSDVFDFDCSHIDEATTPKDIKEWDSLNTLNLIVAIESEFRIKVISLDVSRIGRVGDFVSIIQKKLQ